MILNGGKKKAEEQNRQMRRKMRQIGGKKYEMFQRKWVKQAETQKSYKINLGNREKQKT